MKRFMKYWTVTLLAVIIGIPVLLAEGVDPAVKVQVMGGLFVAIPLLVSLIKKIKQLPVWAVPLIAPAMGAALECLLVLLKFSDLTYGVAALVGLGIGGAASSGYDIHKKIKESMGK